MCFLPFLQMCVVGGLDRVYEIGRQFRNESKLVYSKLFSNQGIVKNDEMFYHPSFGTDCADDINI